MSLFPAAGLASATSHKEVKREKQDPFDWLQNNSYNPSRASELVKLQDSQFSGNESSEFSEDEEKIKEDKKERRKRKHQLLPNEELKKVIKKEHGLDGPNLGKVSFIVEQLESNIPKFKTDKIKDMDNVHFGRPYKVLMPKFYRGLVYCVGTPKWKDLQLKESRKKKKKRKVANCDRDERYFAKKLQSTVNFISSVRGKTISFGSHLTEDCVKISGGNSQGAPLEDSDGNPDDLLKKTTEELNRRTRENPNDLDGWFELLAWQDEVMKDYVVHGRSRILSEKKVEILNQAIKANPKVPKLQLMKINLQSNLISDTAALDKEWQNLLFRFPDNIEVWQEYVSYINCNNFTAFSLKRTRRAYAHCIEILRSINTGTYKQEAYSEISAEKRLVQLLSEYSHFLAATGHTEQWVALYQCVLELNFRGPTSEISWSDTVDYLKLYFSSKERKLGERGSKGFRLWAEKHEVGGWAAQDTNNEDKGSDDEDDVDMSKSLTENWLKIERSRCERHWLPWRPSFDGDEVDDEERKVLFTDIKDLLFVVDGIRHKTKLLSDFLHLLGSPACYGSTMLEPFSTQNIFFFAHPLQLLRKFENLLLIKPILIGKSQTSNLGTLDGERHEFIREIFAQLQACCDNNELKVMLSTAYMTYYEHRTISFYLDNKPVELKKCRKEARETAKSSLRAYPNLFRVWSSLGVIEWLCGKRTEACKIFQTTLVTSSETLSSLDRQKRSKLRSDMHYLCRNFAQLHFSTCMSCPKYGTDRTECCPLRASVLAMLTALADDYKFSDDTFKADTKLRPTNVMRTMSGFVRLLEECRSLYEQYEFEKNMDNIAENEFLSSYFDLLSCHFVFLVTSSSLNDYSILDDAVLFLQKQIAKGSIQAKIDLENLYILYLCHLKENSGRYRKLYRKIIYKAATEFPNNFYFAQLFGEVDIASYLCGNVRRHFTRVCSQNSNSIVPWLCAIHFELARRRRMLDVSTVGVAETGRLLDTRILNLFEHAISVASNSGSVALWRAYLATQADMDPEKIKGIYTRAVNSCSWSRDLHLDILSWDADMLAEVVSNLSQKGLRLRTPIEEIQLLMAM